MEPAFLAYLVISFFLISLLYSSVGFGGGSSYLAIMSIYLKDFLLMKTTGLLCNLVVVSNGTFLFGNRGYIHWRKWLPIILSGVPLAFLGATIHLSHAFFFASLGGVLALSGLLLLWQVTNRKADKRIHTFHPAIIMVLAACIGFASGLVGIGGGILLSPILNLLRWDEPKKIAALASLFILVNSIAGLAGQVLGGTFKTDGYYTWLLMGAVFLGGQLGTRISLNIIKPSFVKGLTGILVCYIGIRLLVKYTNGISI